jgi:hypothetical protein
LQGEKDRNVVLLSERLCPGIGVSGIIQKKKATHPSVQPNRRPPKRKTGIVIPLSVPPYQHSQSDIPKP